MRTFVTSEVSTINRMLQANNVMAKVVKATNVLSSYIRYQLRLHPQQSFVGVEKLIRELTVAVNRNRQRHRLPTTELKPVESPTFALEANHPKPSKVLWKNELTDLKPHTMLCGLSDNNQSEIVSFEDTPHVLIAGMTGSGKSMLLQMMLASLKKNTPDLQLILIDLKNEDLVPFKNLGLFAGNREKAIQLIDYVVAEKEKRIATSICEKRIVLVIDELAQLATDKRIQDKLSDLISIGRSKRINLIAATQNVTKSGGIGSMLKANFTCRLIGKVAPGQSQIATSLPKQYAHLLPGKGSFLRIEGMTNHRFQSFYFPDYDLDLFLENLKPLKPVLSTVTPSLVVEPAEPLLKPVLEPVKRFSEPLAEPRQLTVEEARIVRDLYANGKSKNSLCKLVFGSKNGKTLGFINEALESKIIRLRDVA